MFFGLPLRVAKTTTESLTKPFVRAAFQSASTRPASTSAGDVGLEGQRDDVGAEAGLDGPALLAGGAVGLLEASRPRRPGSPGRPG